MCIIKYYVIHRTDVKPVAIVNCAVVCNNTYDESQSSKFPNFTTVFILSQPGLKLFIYLKTMPYFPCMQYL